MSAMASQITDVSIVYSTVCWGADQRKHQGSVSLAFVRGIHRLPVDSPNKGPVTQNMFSFDDVFMQYNGMWTQWGPPFIPSISITTQFGVLSHLLGGIYTQHTNGNFDMLHMSGASKIFGLIFSDIILCDEIFLSWYNYSGYCFQNWMITWVIGCTVKTNALKKKRVIVLIWKMIFILKSLFLKRVTYILIPAAISI